MYINDVMYLMLFTYVRIARVKEWDFNNMENKASLVLCSLIIWTISVTYLCNVVLNHLCAD